ncbi:MAG TPA: DinB family protein [Pyrinomonadaceae bacterium]|nr:DinB family protein [Pyrinomonadaceae bacterium]
MSTHTATVEGAEISNAGALAPLLGDLAALAEEAQREFGALSARQLNWKPDAKQWSVGQCLEHLIKTNGAYFPRLEQMSRGEWKPTAWERLGLLSKFFGRTLLKFVSPESKLKANAPSRLKPSGSGVDARVVNSFVEHQQRLAELMRANDKLDPERVYVTSPVASFVTYSLLDGYRVIVAHERRHLAQARRVTQMEGFPKE